MQVWEPLLAAHTLTITGWMAEEITLPGFSLQGFSVSSLAL